LSNVLDTELVTLERHTCSFAWETNIALSCFVFMVGDKVAGFCEGGNEVSGCIKYRNL